ncbi:hypothetical protein [Motiliproteus sp. SC1-56]|uniref:hypothetical protein n=1 Tax=Motiliproteus sp. SC1-56 TaxID=2799565 RepID=UPI001A8CEC8F|nr:hypothetical protein [Motiliproteus sp. SC1-56]
MIDESWADRLERMKRKGEERFRTLLENHGGALSAAETADLLGCSLESLDELREQVPLFAFQQNAEWHYPNIQFERGSVLPGIAEVGQALRHLDPISRVQFLFSTVQFGDRKGNLCEEQTVIDLIRQGDLEPVLFQAKLTGQQIAT